MLKKDYFFISVILLIFSFSANAEIFFSKLTTEDGLSGNPTRAILQDKQGFLWFGTNEGLDRYDGLEIRSFNHEITDDAITVNALAEDSSQNLYIGTDRGLWVRKRGQISFIRIPSYADQSQIIISSITILSKDHVVAGSNNGIYVINNKDFSASHIALSNIPGSLRNHVTGLFSDSDSVVWITTRQGIMRYYIETNEVVSFSKIPQLDEGSFTAVTSLNGAYYIGTSNNGLYCFNIEEKSVIQVPDISNPIILSLVTNGKDKIYVGTDGGGLNILDANTNEVSYETHSQNDNFSISSNSVYSLFIDRDLRIWIGTYSGGINYGHIYNQGIHLFNPSGQSEIKSESIRSLCFVDDNLTLVGTRDGLYVFDHKTEKVEKIKSTSQNRDGLRANIILTIKRINSTVYIGTYGGGLSLFDIKTKQMQPFIDHKEFMNGCIYDIEPDSSGNIWISSLNGLYMYNPDSEKIIHYDTENSEISSNEIFSLMFDRDSNIWIGTSQGVDIYKIKEFKLHKLALQHDSEDRFKVNYIYQDKERNIWVCKESGGLTKYSSDLKSIVTLTQIDGLPNNSVCAITEQPEHTFWISTLKGLCRYESGDSTFRQFGIAEGLPSFVFTPSCIWKEKSRKLWFGTERGLISFFPDSLKRDLKVLSPVITDIYLFGKKATSNEIESITSSVELADTLKFKNSQNSVGFRFVDFNYDNASTSSFLYMLEGYDDNWKRISGSNVVFYQKLPAGKYIFRIKPLIQNVKSSDVPVKKVLIIIKPSVLKHPLFLIPFFLIIALTGFYSYERITKTIKDLKVSLAKLTTDKEKYVGSKLAEDHVSLIKERLNTFMETEKPYLNPDLKMSDVALSIGFSTHEISQVLNQDLQQSFPDYVNIHRVEELKRRMQKDDVGKFTLVAIAQQCGFKSKTSFYRNFNKVVGVTPAEYFKRDSE
ncbi:two-component regulator propeller domain-containing protein [Saccharicrinis sp. FJH62]|uniref:ligand-binding sensor domain-containing protein n=1 Tax=Saccharicrinis sp. FJH62 TaxID=3344657 RepID=UPI0035D3FE2E